MIKYLTGAFTIVTSAVICITCLSLESCTWVELTKQGEAVVIKTQDDITQCQKVAKITASLKSKILGFDRNETKVKTELETLARNKAVEYRGNTLVASSEIQEGEQNFDVYVCP